MRCVQGAKLGASPPRREFTFERNLSEAPHAGKEESEKNCFSWSSGWVPQGAPLGRQRGFSETPGVCVQSSWWPWGPCEVRLAVNPSQVWKEPIQRWDAGGWEKSVRTRTLTGRPAALSNNPRKFSPGEPWAPAGKSGECAVQLCQPALPQSAGTKKTLVTERKNDAWLLGTELEERVADILGPWPLRNYIECSGSLFFGNC